LNELGEFLMRLRPLAEVGEEQVIARLEAGTERDPDDACYVLGQHLTR
jgi:hypothetical protein